MVIKTAMCIKSGKINTMKLAHALKGYMRALSWSNFGVFCARYLGWSQKSWDGILQKSCELMHWI